MLYTYSPINSLLFILSLSSVFIPISQSGSCYFFHSLSLAYFCLSIYHFTHSFTHSLAFLLTRLHLPPPPLPPPRCLSFSPYLVVIALPLSSRHFIAGGWVDFAPLHWPNYVPRSVVYHARYTCFPLFVLSENGGPKGAAGLKFGSAFQMACLSKRSRRGKVRRV